MNIEHLNDWLLSKKKQSLIMGILNITPDSFSDGGDFFEKNIAIDRALEMVEQGADIIDIGGESTRPFSDSVSLKEEISRVIPVIEGICKESDVCISIDTTKSKVASEALEAGASVINDISAMEIDSLMVDVALKFNCPIVLMHMKGNPRNMQNSPKYKNTAVEIIQFLAERIKVARKKNIIDIIVDPGFGFGKTVEHNFEILNNLENFKALGAPLLTGFSRKSMIFGGPHRIC